MFVYILVIWVTLDFKFVLNKISYRNNICLLLADICLVVAGHQCDLRGSVGHQCGTLQ